MKVDITRIYEVERSLQWARALQEAVDKLTKAGYISTEARNICKSVSRLSWLPACLQALTFCRFSELKSIDLGELLVSDKITLKQSKTKTDRIVYLQHFDLELDAYDLEPDARILHTNYDAYRNDLKRVIPRRIHKVLEFSSDITHVFRHLHASYLHASGYTIKEIMAEFGHTSEETTRRYIHPELFS